MGFRASMVMALGLAGAVLAGEEAVTTFSVLKIAKGRSVAYEAVASDQIEERKAQLQDEFKRAEKAWERAKAAFEKRAASAAPPKDGKPPQFARPKPEEAVVSVEKDGFKSEEEAQKFAEEKMLSAFEAARKK